MRETSIAPAEVLRVASIDLGEGGDVLRVAPDRWPSVIWGLTFQRLTGIAVAGWEAGRLELLPEQLDDLIERHRSAMALALMIEQQLLKLSPALGSAGVRAVVLKGCAVAHSLYPDPSMRP